MPTCPNGHLSSAADYCDICGAPLTGETPSGVVSDGGSAASAPPFDPPAAGTGSGAGDPDAAGAGSKPCPHCQGANPASALFCEACGYDFTTGALPRDAIAEDAELGDELVRGAPDPAEEVDMDVDVVSLDPVAPADQGSAPEVWAEVPSDGGSVEPDLPDLPEVLASAPLPADLGSAPLPTDPALSSAPGPGPGSGPNGWVAEVWIDPDWYAGQDSPDQLPSPGLPRVIPLSGRSALIGRPSRSRGIVPDLDCEPDTGVSRRHAELITDGSRWWVEDLGSANGTYVGLPGAALPDLAIAVRTELVGDARIYAGSWTRIVVRLATPGEF